MAVIEAQPRWTRFGHATDRAEIRGALESAGLRIDAEHDFAPNRTFLVGRC